MSPSGLTRPFCINPCRWKHYPGDLTTNMATCHQMSLVCLVLVLCTYSLSVRGASVNALDQGYMNDFLSDDDAPMSTNEKRAILTRGQALREYCLLRGKFDMRCRMLLRGGNRQPVRVITISS